MAKECVCNFFASRLAVLVQYRSPAYVVRFHLLSEGRIDATSKCNRGVERVRYTHFSWCDLKNSILTSHQCLPSDFRLIKKHRREKLQSPCLNLSLYLPEESQEKTMEDNRGIPFQEGQMTYYLKYFERKSWDNFQFLPCLLSIHWKAGYEEKQVTKIQLALLLIFTC